MKRSIIHVDMDAFYASVEALDNPELKGMPVLVGGSPEQRGVISAASYEAREFGVHSAMPTSTALRKCPHAILLPVRMKRYVEVSRRIRDTFERFTPLVEPLSLDEAFLDVTGSERLFGPAPEIGRRLKHEIREATNLTASVGVAPNKFLAKLGSDLNKPDGFTLITEANKLDILRPLPVSRLWGVGKATAPRLKRLGLLTFGHVQDAPPDLLRQAFGRDAEHFRQLALGEDDRPVVPETEAKSLGTEQTFSRDLDDADEMLAVLLEQTEEVAWRLRSNDLVARTVTLKIRYADFRLITRRTALPKPTDLTSDLWKAVKELFAAWNRRERGQARLLGVTASGLSDHRRRQKSLFPDENRRKQRKLTEAADQIREKFGDGALKRGLLIPRPEESDA